MVHGVSIPSVVALIQCALLRASPVTLHLHLHLRFVIRDADADAGYWPNHPTISYNWMLNIT